MKRFCVFPDARLPTESPNPTGRKTFVWEPAVPQHAA